MKKWYLLLAVLAACQPARNTYLKDVALNFHDSGFLSPHVFQVFCRSQQSDFAEDRPGFLQNCRLQAVMALADYKIQYDLDKMRRNRLAAGRPASFAMQWTPARAQSLLELYADLLPGYLVAEKLEGSWHSGLYRLQAENLIRRVQKRELPFSYPGHETEEQQAKRPQDSPR